jgi:hypothetical protein
MDGEFVPWGAAKVHVRAECVMRGLILEVYLDWCR